MEIYRKPGLFKRGRKLYTENGVPGEAVYGEPLVKEGEVEYREFDPFHCKLAAYVLKGGRSWPFDHVERVLYLGAGSGSTVSHVADILPNAQIYAVERFPRPYAALLRMSKERSNLFPILGDAQRPERYRHWPGEVDLIYQDVAQRNQVDILLQNARACLDPDGVVMLQLKTRSVTQAESPRNVLTAATDGLRAGGFEVEESLDLAPFSRDHFAMVLRRRVGRGTGPRR